MDYECQILAFLCISEKHLRRENKSNKKVDYIFFEFRSRIKANELSGAEFA